MTNPARRPAEHRRDHVSLYIVGAGGFGRETLDATVALDLEVTAFLDEHREGQVCRELPVHGLDAVSSGDGFVVAISDPEARSRLAKDLLERGATARSIVDHRTIIGPETSLGAGCVILGNAFVSSSVRVGGHTHINYNASIGHDTVLGDLVTVLPGANVGGNVTVERGALIGSNACVLQGLTIGPGAVVGAGAVVTREVTAGATVVGVPARAVGPDGSHSYA